MTEIEKNEQDQEVESAGKNGKEPKGKFWKGVLIGSLATAFCGILAAAVASGIWMVGRGVKSQGNENIFNIEAEQNASGNDSTTEAKSKLNLDHIGGKLNVIEATIDRYFLFDEEAAEDSMSAEDWIYTAYVMSYGDPYTSYYTAEDYAALVESTEGEYCGVGIMLSQDVYTGYINVLKVFKGAPAEVGGMLPGDIVTAVEDVDVTGMDLSLVVSDHIKGEEGTDVTITVYRESVEDYVDLTMTRAIVQNPTVEYEMLDNKIGYVNLSSFEVVSFEQFVKAVEELDRQGMESLILDLRNNTGGVVETAEHIADYILPDGKDVVSFKGKAVDDSTYVSKDGHQLDLPMVVLVNDHSASASEILSGALEYHDAAVIVGTKTYGKGIAQGLFEMIDGSALKLTTAYYYLPSGECIHKEGIAPDIEVELNKELKTLIEIPKDQDNQLQVAVDVLLEGEEAAKAKLEAENEESRQNVEE